MKVRWGLSSWKVQVGCTVAIVWEEVGLNTSAGTRTWSREAALLWREDGNHDTCQVSIPNGGRLNLDVTGLLNF